MRVLPLYVGFALLKHVVPLPALAKWAWRVARGARRRDAERHALVAVARVRQWMGREDDCLQASLALYRELSRLGADPVLAVGFRRERERLDGHAWVIVDGRTVPEEPLGTVFDVAFAFGPQGRVQDGPRAR